MTRGHRTRAPDDARAAGPRGGRLRGQAVSFAPASMQAPGRRGAAGARAGSVCSGGPGCVPGPSPAWVRSSGSRRLVGDLQAWSTSLDWAPEAFSLRVRLEETGEMFRVTNCRLDMTVRELKEELDLMAGIPFNLQRLQYLDQGVLMDGSTLRFHDVVPGGVISLCIWHYDGWTELVLAAVEGDPNKLSCLGIGKDSFYCTPFSQHLEGAARKQWMAQRAFVALYVTSHRGHAEAVQYLLEHGTSCIGRTPLGRTPLHAAAAMGRLECISLLFQAGASIRDKDAKGETPISIAHRLNRKQSARRMFLLHWMAKTAILNRKLARWKAPQGGRTGIRLAASHHDSQGFGPARPPEHAAGQENRAITGL